MRHARRALVLVAICLALVAACTPEQIVTWNTRHPSTPFGADPASQVTAQDWWCGGGWQTFLAVDTPYAYPGPLLACPVLGYRIPPGWTIELRPGICGATHGTATPHNNAASRGHICVDTSRPGPAWQFTAVHEIVGHAWGLWLGRHPSIPQEYEQVANCAGVIAGYPEVYQTDTYRTAPHASLRCPGPGTWQYTLASELINAARR